MLDGSREVLNYDTLIEPPSVAAQRASMIQKQDTVANFIADALEPDKKAFTFHAKVATAYKDYCSNQRHAPAPPAHLREALINAGYTTYHRYTGTGRKDRKKGAAERNGFSIRADHE